MRACADLAEGVLAAAGGDHERARRLFEDAVDRFAASGAPYELARAKIELAATLAALGREEAADREAAAALRRAWTSWAPRPTRRERAGGLGGLAEPAPRCPS